MHNFCFKGENLGMAPRFCAQFPRVEKIFNEVQIAVEAESSLDNDWAKIKSEIDFAFHGIYNIAPVHTQQNTLGAIKLKLDSWSKNPPESDFLNAIRHHIDSFFGVAAEVYRAFPVMGESFLDGKYSFCDTLLTAGVEEADNGTLKYKWTHPIVLLPIYELLLELCEGEISSGMPELDDVLYYETLYTRLLRRYIFCQPYKHKLYRFHLDLEQGCVVGIPLEQHYVFHKILPYRLTEKICYSVKEFLESDGKYESSNYIRIALIGSVPTEELEQLTELLLEELKPGGHMIKKEVDPFTLEITICDTQCQNVPAPKNRGKLTIKWVAKKNVDITDNVSLHNIYETYDVAFYLDLSAMYRPRAQEYYLSGHLPKVCVKGDEDNKSAFHKFQHTRRCVNYLTDFLREQSAAYTMRRYANSLSINNVVLGNLLNLYKNSRDESKAKPRLAYLYLSHEAISESSSAKYENISRIENYDGDTLAIIRLSNTDGTNLTRDPELNLFPVTLWQILKSIRSEIALDLLEYFKRGKMPYLSKIDQQWRLIYALRRIYIVLKFDENVLAQDKLEFYCLADEGDLKSTFSDIFQGEEERSSFIEALRSFASDVFLGIWHRVAQSVRNPDGMTDYAEALHSAVSKALYGRIGTLEHALLWHLYESKVLCKKEIELDDTIHEEQNKELKAQIFKKVIELFKRASDQPTDKPFYAHLISSTDSNRLGLMDIKKSVDLYQFFHQKEGAPNLTQKLMLLNKCYEEVASTCAHLGYTDSRLYSSAIMQSDSLR